MLFEYQGCSCCPFVVSKLILKELPLNLNNVFNQRIKHLLRPLTNPSFHQPPPSKAKNLERQNLSKNCHLPITKILPEMIVRKTSILNFFVFFDDNIHFITRWVEMFWNHTWCFIIQFKSFSRIDQLGVN